MLPAEDYQHGKKALARLLELDGFHTVLDIGSGRGWHAAQLRAAGKQVVELDLEPRHDGAARCSYEDYHASQPFDCVWCCHVLEHQPNVNLFLTKIHRDLRDGGWLAVVVPPLKHQIVGGHLSLWNAGLLLYNLVVARFDCRDAKVSRSGYDIAVLVRRREIELPVLYYGAMDVDRLTPFFPEGLTEGFNGDITELNWD